MRILIDFLDGPDAVAPAALSLAQALARHASAHDMWLAVPDDPDAVDTLALAFAGLLPRARIRAFALVGPPTMRTLLRRHALASLAPDTVLAMSRTAAAADAADATAPTVQIDPAIDAASLMIRLAASATEPMRLPAPLRKPRLAYISPLPPARSGIADYSAALAPQLARYYELELVVAQDSVHDARLDGLPQRPVDWFRRHAQRYDRVLYQVGNAPLHGHMFDLIREVPGVVVLHDFYLGNAIEQLAHQGRHARGFEGALYESHGYTGLLALRRDGRHPAAWAYPVNKGILDHASGVIVHGEYPKQLARQWFGPDAADRWHTIPLLRGKPQGSAQGSAQGSEQPPDARAAARKRLGIAHDSFLVCSFGMLGPTKMNMELVQAFLASPLARDARCALVFVGDNAPGQYGDALLARRRAAAAIRIAGYVDAARYADYLAACDVAVQLRRDSRGETSAALLDCLLYGVPTIANAHGAAAALADDACIKLPDEVDTDALAGALARLRDDAGLRARLAQRASATIQAEHAPDRAGRLCAEAIEQVARHGEHTAYRALVAAAAPLCAADALATLAGAIAFNRATSGPRQLLVDVSALVQTDLRTGIQRVVRSILLALVAAPPQGYRIEPVFSSGGNRGYRYAHSFGLGLVEADGLALEDAPVELRPGDIFLGLDLFVTGTAQNAACLRAMRARGVAIHFCMYDLLPVLLPDAFPFGTDAHFSAFLRTVYEVADGIVCISRAVADELAGWIAARDWQRVLPLELGYFHLGADIDASAPSKGLPLDAGLVLAALRARPSVLVVGTVEPRKGHAQALAAFELLWEGGEDINLVVVGKQGWLVDALAARLRGHAEQGKRLFWLAGVSDEMLDKLYAGASALLAPSIGEGFGLPLIEAARHRIPIVARDLPVFREVAGEYAHYFSGLAPSDLARALRDWLALRRTGQAPPSAGMPWLSWEASARQLVDAIIGGRWYRRI